LAYSPRFIAVLGVGGYLTGFAFRRLTACTTATVMLALGLAPEQGCDTVA